MLRDCSSHNDFSQGLPRFNQKRLEKCSTERGQPYQPKPVAIETVDPNRYVSIPILKNLSSTLLDAAPRQCRLGSITSVVI